MQWFEMAGLSVMIIVGFGSVAAIIMRWFRHRERLAMIRQGLVPEDLGARARGGTRKRRGLLLGGLSIALLGLLLLCAAFFVAVPSASTLSLPSGFSSIGLIPLPGLLVAFMGVGLLILYVWSQPTVERRARAAAAPAVEAAPVVDAVVDTQAAELEPYEPEIEPWQAPTSEDTAPSTLDAKVPSDDQS
jgi:hypothetical protein